MGSIETVTDAASTPQVGRTNKTEKPHTYRRPKMRMANHNRLDASLAPHKLDRLVIDQRNRVPQHIPARRLQQDAALPDAELLARRGRVRQPRRQLRRDFGLGRDVVDPWVALVGREFVFLQRGFARERGPGLACWWDVLAWVLKGGFCVVLDICRHCRLLFSFLFFFMVEGDDGGGGRNEVGNWTCWRKGFVGSWRFVFATLETLDAMSLRHMSREGWSGEGDGDGALCILTSQILQLSGGEVRGESY